MSDNPGLTDVAAATEQPRPPQSRTRRFNPAWLLIAPAIRATVVRLAVPVTTPPRATCDACGAPTAIARASRPAGRCHRCLSRLGPTPYLVELATVAATAVIIVDAVSAWQTAALIWWTAWALPLAFIDVAVHRLPDRLTYPAAGGVTVILAAAAAATHNAAGLTRGLIAGAAGALLFAALTFLLGRHGPGLGDAKLLFSALAYLASVSWTVLSDAILVTFAGQALCGIVLLVLRRPRRSLPLGPFLAVGVLLAPVVHLHLSI